MNRKCQDFFLSLSPFPPSFSDFFLIYAECEIMMWIFYLRSSNEKEAEKCLSALVADYGFSMDNNWEIMHGEICDKMLDKRGIWHNKVKLARETWGRL